MKRYIKIGYVLFVAFSVLSEATELAAETSPVAPKKWDLERYHSPNSVAVSAARKELYVVNTTMNTLSIIDQEQRALLAEVHLGRFPVDAVLSKDERVLYVSCLYDYCVQAIDLDTREVIGKANVGYEPYGLCLSSDGQRLYVANSISDTVMALNAATLEVIFERPVGRAPKFIVELPESKRIAVSNGLSRYISILDSITGELLEERAFGRASLMKAITALQGGEYLIAAGLIAHDDVVTMQIERGWINSNGLYVMKPEDPKHAVIVPLDSLLNGAANPWDVVISPDQKTLYVSLAGMHEVAYVDLEKFLALVESTRPEERVRLSQDVEVFDRLKLGKRVETGGLGPRGMALDAARNELYVANYFSNDISVMDAISGEVQAVIALGEAKEMTLWRKGELLFNDARICQQNYYSCASCHQEDATMDGLNWDLINDGRGNPKNAKSLHDSMDTPPVMWSGVRANMFAGVAAGQRFLGFIPNEANHEALLEFIGNPRRAPNPYLAENTDAAKRGEVVFYRSRCHACHYGSTYTDGRKHDVGLRAPFELRSRFYTPSLRETYRTGPFLHHGFADTYEEIFREYNQENKHGLTSHLSDEELDDLIAYLKTL